MYLILFDCGEALYNVLQTRMGLSVSSYVPSSGIYGRNDERGENRDEEEESEIPGGGDRVEIAWPLVCK